MLYEDVKLSEVYRRCIFSPDFLLREEQNQPTKNLSEEEIKNLFDRIISAKYYLFNKTPFYSRLLSKFSIYYLQPSNPHDIDTMAVDQNGDIFFTPWINTLSDEQLQGVLCHEMMHVALLTLHRLGDKNTKLWNIATDILINKYITADGLELPKEGLIPQQYIVNIGASGNTKENEVNLSNRESFKNDLMNTNVPKKWYMNLSNMPAKSPECEKKLQKLDITDLSAEDVYYEIKNCIKNSEGDSQGEGKGGQGKDGQGKGGQGKGGQGKGKGGQGKDGKGQSKDGQGHGQGRVIDQHIYERIGGNIRSEKEQETIVRQTVAEVRQNPGQQGWGQGQGGDTLSKIDKNLGASKVNWKSILRDFITTSKRQYDYKQYSRMGQSSKIPDPKLVSKPELDLVLAIDNSGSIGDDIYKMFITECIYLFKSLNARVDVIFWDTEIRRFYTVEPGTYNRLFERLEPGGTAISVVKYFIEKQLKYKLKPPKTIIYLTDGEVESNPVFYKARSLFVLPPQYTGHNLKKYGTVIQLPNK